MKSLINYIKEDYTNSIVDKTISTKEKNKIKTKIYNAIEKSKITEKTFHNDTPGHKDWEGIDEMRNLLQKTLDNIEKDKFNVLISPINGGYRKSQDGLSKWKEYKVEIYQNNNEEPFLLGICKCHAAGSVEDGFEKYDMTLNF